MFVFILGHCFLVVEFYRFQTRGPYKQFVNHLFHEVLQYNHCISKQLIKILFVVILK